MVKGKKEICDDCTKCHWFSRDDENNCDGAKETCIEFIKED